VTADGLGFLLNDEMDDFSAKPGVPNADGLIQGAANEIGPGKRPLSSMTPTIVGHNGKTVLVLGSPGSSKIITTVANVLMGVVDYGMNIQEAVNAPRFHNQWIPDVVNVEKWFSPDTLNILEGSRCRPTGAMPNALQWTKRPAKGLVRPMAATAAARPWDTNGQKTRRHPVFIDNHDSTI
jgi:gamma-glutamyltranspeptidase